MIVYVCTKFRENILNGVRAMERTRMMGNGRTYGHTDGHSNVWRVYHNNLPFFVAGHKKLAIGGSEICSLNKVIISIFVSLVYSLLPKDDRTKVYQYTYDLTALWTSSTCTNYYYYYYYYYYMYHYNTLRDDRTSYCSLW